MYIEEVMMDGTGTVTAIQSMENNYELIIVGRRHDAWSPLILGLKADFNGSATILVVQQHYNTLNEWYDSTKGSSHVPHDIDEAEDLPIQRNSVSAQLEGR
ncbi:unnamed protein product [Ilex paraguariensis]|uniref:UspA domain-containing protein n=1 Tax=Ilex paraguariensis TaxID=185542 RepID=A0ABC8URS6_9AQUA